MCLQSRHSGNGQVSEARYVHGNLRLRNLAAKYVEGQNTSVIMLDLDWAGTYGTQVYLADINPSIAPFTRRPAGVQRGAVMLQIHDLETIQSDYKAKVSEHLVDMELTKPFPRYVHLCKWALVTTGLVVSAPLKSLDRPAPRQGANAAATQHLDAGWDAADAAATAYIHRCNTNSIILFFAVPAKLHRYSCSHCQFLATNRRFLSRQRMLPWLSC